MTQIRSCMGGFCHLRDACASHHAEDRSHPVERMCPKGLEDPVPLPREPWVTVGVRVMRVQGEAA